MAIFPLYWAAFRVETKIYPVYIVWTATSETTQDWNRYMQLTPDNSNPRELEPKSISPGFPSYIYCNFTLDNSNLPLTRSNFCFPSAHFYTILPSITRTMLWPRDKSGKNRVLKSGTLNVFQNNLYFTIFTFLSLQFKFSVHSCILCCLIAFPSHPFAYFLTSGYLLQTPDNSNFFRFPLNVRVIGSRL